MKIKSKSERFPGSPLLIPDIAVGMDMAWFDVK
jgi:hypothetical protein